MKGRKLITRIVALVLTAFMIVSSSNFNYPIFGFLGKKNVKVVEAADSDTMKDTMDPKLYSVIKILYNYQKANSNGSFYDVVEDKGLDPYSTDITTLPEAATYLNGNEITYTLYGALKGTINLYPYNDIKSYTGLSSGKSVTTIVMPSNITEITKNTFLGMINLKTVEMPAAVTKIGDNAFESCTKLTTIRTSKVGSENLLDLANITEIGAATFSGCASIVNVRLYDSKEDPDQDLTNFNTKRINIGGSAFKACSSLKSVKLPFGNLGNAIFQSCTGLEEVYFNDAFNQVPDAFLQKAGKGMIIHLPKSLVSIGHYSFAESKINSMNLCPDSEDDNDFCANLKYIYDYAFEKCLFGSGISFDFRRTKLEEIRQDSFFGAYFANLNSEGFVIPDTLKYMGIAVFALSGGLTKVHFPSSLNKIPDATFFYSTDLSKVDIESNNLEEIGKNAFDCCTSLTNIDFLSKVYTPKLKLIDDYAFQRCVPQNTGQLGDAEHHGLRSVNVPDSVIMLGTGVFMYDFTVTSAYMGAGVKEIPDNAFYVPNTSSTIDIDDLSVSANNVHTDDWTGENSDRDQTINIDDDHDEFSYDPYMNEMVSQIGMNTLQLSDKLVSIGDRAFHGQCNLSTICLTNEAVTDNIDNAKFADTLVGIGEEAFMYCSYETDEEIEGTEESLYTYYGLKNVVLPDKMSELGNSAFSYDYSLQSVHLPIKGLRTIPENCFSGCGFIEEKPQYTDFDEDGRVEEAPNPGKYHGLTTINLDEMENLLYIKEDAFLRNYCLSAALPDSLRAIGDEAFYQVYNTNSLDFGTEIIYIGEEAFSNTGILDENFDGDYIFMVADFTNSGLSNKKNGLQDVNFAIAANLGKESAKTPDENWFDYGIDDEAFYRSPIKELDTLSSTAIPEVSYGAFSDCYNLTIALCPDTVEAIKGKAFVNCRKLEQVTFPVYATLTQNMINGDCKKVTLIPNLGRYRGKIFTVPMGQRIALPSNSFRNHVNMKISQRVYGESEVPQTDLKPEERIFEIVNGEKDALDIIGSDSEFVGTDGNPGAYAIVSSYVQFEEKTINMSIEYPLDIKAVPAESVRFEEKLFEMSSGTPGHVVESGIPNVPDTLYINGDYVGRKLTLVAAVDPRLPEEAEGHVTENVNWTEETEALKKVKQWLVDEDGDEIEDTNNDGVVDEKDVKGRVLYSAAQYEIKKALPAQEIEAWVGSNKENAEINKIAVSICNPIDDIVYYMDSVGIEESKRISYFEMPEASNPGSDTPSGTTEVIKYSYEYDEDGDATDRTDNLIVYTKNNLNEQNLPIISIVSNDPSKGELEIMALREGEADVYLESATKSEREDFSIRVKKPADGVAPVVVSIESETVDEDGNPEYIDGKGNGFVYQNQTSRFKAVCLPKYATQSVDWSLDDNDGVMTLSNDNGIAVVKGLLLDYDYLIGKTTVASGSEKAELKINVIEMSEGIEFLQDELSIEAGDKDYIDIVSSRDEKEGLLRLPVESKDIVTFTVEDSNIAKVSTSRDGVYGKSASTQDTIYFTGIKNGSTVLTASTKNGSTSQITINVVEKPITDIRFDTEDITLYEGESRANTATIVPADSTEKIVYSSNDPSVATVDPSTGKVTAVSAGETRIYAEGVLSGEDDYYYVTVTKKATGLLFNKDKDAVYKDEIHSVSITTEEDADEGLIIAPEDSHEEVTFTVKDPTIVQVSATDDEGTYGRSCVSTKKCYYKGIKTGETTIECVTASGLKAIYTVRVVGIKIEELAFAKESYTVMAGSTVATKVTKTPSTSDEIVEYISDDPSIAKVDANGVITGVKVGETEITAKSVPGGEKAYCKVVVTKKVNPGDPGSTAVSGDAKVRVNSDGKSATYEGSVAAAGAVTIPATVSVGGKTLPVTAIKAGAFKNNAKITKVVIGPNVTTIGANAFEGCTKLKTVTIGAKVTTIGNFAFKNCKSLTKIVIPKSVTTIGKQAFAGCSKLKLVTFKTTKLKKVGAKAFKTIKKGAKFKCPKKKLKAYKKLLKKSGLPKKAKVTK